MTATVTSENSFLTAPTGSVSFYAVSGNHTIPLKTVPMQPGGIESLTTSSLPAGQLQITATYSGDSVYLDSFDQKSITVGSSGATAISIAHSTLPASIVSGAAIHSNLKIELVNSFASAEQGVFTVNVYAAPNGTP